MQLLSIIDCQFHIIDNCFNMFGFILATQYNFLVKFIFSKNDYNNILLICFNMSIFLNNFIVNSCFTYFFFEIFIIANVM